MKHYKSLFNMIAFAISALLLLGCRTTELTPTDEIIIPFSKSDLIKTYELSTEGKNYALVGDTILPRKTTPLSPMPSTQVDLSNIKGNATGVFKYIAVGASLTSGVRDGGWFNDGIQTSYPNLIARQMGIADFKQALFNDKEFNGYGLKIQTTNTETPVPRYKAVSNNIALKTIGVNIALTPFEGTQLNNFAVPNLTDGGYYYGITVANNDNTYYQLQLKRILGQPQVAIETQINSADLVSIESYQQGILRYALSGGSQYQHLPDITSTLTTNPYDIVASSYTGGTDLLLFKLYQKGLKKNILLNVPNILNFPYFKNSLRFSAIKQVFQKFNLTNRDYGYELSEKTMYFPTAILDTLLNPSNSKEKVLDIYLRRFIDRYSEAKGLGENGQKEILVRQKVYNEHIKLLSKKYNTAVVDINSLYQKINDGTYITDDGRKVGDKDFFSSDGLYPSAYGQAIIANECIKTINTFYKTNIPLIKTDFYLKK